MAWITVGVSMESDKRVSPNLWVTLQSSGGELISLSPRQARELAVILQSAADHVDKVKEGTLVTVPESGGK